MFITYNQGNEQPQRIRHNIKLGLRQYTIAFDVHIVKEGENEQYLEDEDSEHQKEWNDMQMWRVEAKRMAKEILEEIKK